jgi:hypothetical protein
MLAIEVRFSFSLWNYLFWFKQEILFNIDDLCPTNAPKRCEWCKGPYHIRKRCPKLASLANEQEKRKQMNNEQQGYMEDHSSYYPNTFRENSYYPPQMYNAQHYNEYYPASEQQVLRYANGGGRRVFNNSHNQPMEQQRNYSHRSYRPNNNNNIKACFKCGSTDHIRAQCPLPNRTNGVQRQKSAS